ncbi:hypothetical protein BD769DRAFT_1341716 [Suillus cothurnatus]|nr:hypothetical protein BD769DRAFT_1341716 [Suillus cothurnatus]
MNRIHSDPGLLICPDFMEEIYRDSHAALISLTISEAQAAELLHAVWVTTNNTLCTQWQQQVLEDERLRAEQQRVAEEKAECQRHALRVEEEVNKVDERKKNWAKHLPIPVCPRPDITDNDVLVSNFTLRKINKGQYVELYYWTNIGLEEAHSSYRTGMMKG